MTDNFEKKVAVDGPVVNAGELGSSTFSPGQALPAGPLGLGQRWTVARKREVVLRLLRDAGSYAGLIVVDRLACQPGSATYIPCTEPRETVLQ